MNSDSISRANYTVRRLTIDVDDGSCVSYLMGNHTIAERMFRHNPSVMLHAPLRTAIWSTTNGPTRFTFDLTPSTPTLEQDMP
jgi:hypothetical protein